MGSKAAGLRPLGPSIRTVIDNEISYYTHTYMYVCMYIHCPLIDANQKHLWIHRPSKSSLLFTTDLLEFRKPLEGFSVHRV
jgi:hypothetical protein